MNPIQTRRSEDSDSIMMGDRVRIARRLQVVDRLLVFAEELACANSVEEVYSVAMQHVPRVVDGYACIVFGAPQPHPSAERIYPVHHPMVSFGVHDLSLPGQVRYTGPELIESAHVFGEVHSSFTPLQWIFHECQLAKAAFIPVGDSGGLLLAERRADRNFGADDWHLLRSVARQIELALERVRKFDDMRDLSLTDPLTGIGNRRRLDFFLDHSLAGARRGDPLTIVLMDLDGFKAVNDREGHLRGDQILRTVARTLQDMVRGSDLVVRYGGDEFLMVLHGDSTAAEALVDRVREQLTDVIGFSVGVAEYESSVSSSEQLVNMADRELYQRKARAVAGEEVPL